MTLGEIVYALLIQPLQILFEFIYGISVELIGNSGISIIILSLAMNFLVLPLYKHADKLQKEERNIQEKLKDGVSHIKKSFSGDERMMMLQTYYRQNNYKPTYVIRSASSLLLQIPFFIAAYRFLSNLDSLHNVKFGIINDLSKPDALITIFGLSVNLLPIIMTAINIISSAIYSKGYPAKDKIQLYLTALVFLVLLYNSPSALVFYWTLNNAFSLVKNILNKSNRSKTVVYYVTSISGLILLLLGLIFKKSLNSENTFTVIICISLLAQYPLIINKFTSKKSKKKLNKKKEKTTYELNKTRYILGCIYMAILTGVVIPSNVIKSSPQEFLYSNYYHNPLWYILASICLSIGTFIIWFGIFYIFSSQKKKYLFEKAIWILCGISTLNYTAFGDWGTLDSSLAYLDDIYFFNKTFKTAIPNLLLIVVIFFVFKIVFDKKKKVITGILTVSIVAFSIIGIYNCVNINSSVSKFKNVQQSDSLHITINKNEQNVVFIMLDRAMGEYIPYLINEKPELQKKFDGFTYYSNVISYGKSTNFGAPALFGGYEYTPAEINSKNSTTLRKKHDEALKIMPVLFSQNNYNVSVYNPKYAGYQFIPDLSIYDDYPDISSYDINNQYPIEEVKSFIKRNKRNFFFYSIARISPVFLQPVINDQGLYFLSNDKQVIDNSHIANGNSKYFLNSFNILKSFSENTEIDSDSNKGNFLFITNDTTHDFQMLQEPEYEPKEHIDNTKYDNDNASRFTVNDKTLLIDDSEAMAQYQSNMAALIQLGNWFDYLRENGVYDNTKIIIASDHGYRSSQMKKLIVNIDGTETDLENFFPLLLVKDFNSTGFTTSDEFMTNADVPTIAFKDTVKNPVNPFTGKAINNKEKYAHSQYILDSMEHSIITNNGNTFKPGIWYSVKDNLWDKDNWKKLADEDVLDTQKAKELDEAKK